MGVESVLLVGTPSDTELVHDTPHFQATEALWCPYSTQAPALYRVRHSSLKNINEKELDSLLAVSRCFSLLIPVDERTADKVMGRMPETIWSYILFLYIKARMCHFNIKAYMYP